MSEILLTQIATGLGVAGFLLMIAVGLSLVFGVLHILDFVHGSIFLFGGYIGFSAVQMLAFTPGGFWLGLAAGTMGAAVLGALIEVVLLRRIYERELLFQFLLLFGVLYILSDVMKQQSKRRLPLGCSDYCRWGYSNRKLQRVRNGIRGNYNADSLVYPCTN